MMHKYLSLLISFLALLPYLNSALKMEYSYFGKFAPPNNGIQRNNVASAGAVYYVSTTTSNWGDAWFSCQQAFNGRLLAVETPEEDNFIQDLMIKDGRSNVWTSGAFDDFNGLWKWASNNEPINNAQWGPNEPSSTNANSRVVIINSLFSRYWAVSDSGASRYSICEVRNDGVTTSTTTITTTVGTTPLPGTTPPPPPTTTTTPPPMCD